MKRIIAMLLTVILCLCLAGCGKTPESEQSPQETHTETTDTEEEKPQSGSASPSGNTAGQPEEPARQSIELVGPWHLDSEKNDLAAFACILSSNNPWFCQSKFLGIATEIPW